MQMPATQRLEDIVARSIVALCSKAPLYSLTIDDICDYINENNIYDKNKVNNKKIGPQSVMNALHNYLSRRLPADRFEEMDEALRRPGKEKQKMIRVGNARTLKEKQLKDWDDKFKNEPLIVKLRDDLKIKKELQKKRIGRDRRALSYIIITAHECALEHFLKKLPDKSLNISTVRRLRMLIETFLDIIFPRPFMDDFENGLMEILSIEAMLPVGWISEELALEGTESFSQKRFLSNWVEIINPGYLWLNEALDSILGDLKNPYNPYYDSAIFLKDTPVHLVRQFIKGCLVFSATGSIFSQRDYQMHNMITAGNPLGIFSHCSQSFLNYGRDSVCRNLCEILKVYCLPDVKKLFEDQFWGEIKEKYSGLFGFGDYEKNCFFINCWFTEPGVPVFSHNLLFEVYALSSFSQMTS